MEARACSAPCVRSEEESAGVLLEPPSLFLEQLGRPWRGKGQLRQVVAELRLRSEQLRTDPGAVEAAWSWARACQDAGRFPDLEVDELAVLRLCVGPKEVAVDSGEPPEAALAAPDFLGPMNGALLAYQPGARSMACLDGTCGHMTAEQDDPQLWEAFAGGVVSGLAALRRGGHAARPGRGAVLRRCAWVPQESWARHFSEGQALCFTEVQSLAEKEPWGFLDRRLHDCVPCVLEFDESFASEATGVQVISESHEEEFLLPPYARGVVRSVSSERAPAPRQEQEVFRVQLEGRRCPELLQEVLEEPAESVLAGALLIGLQAGGTDAVCPLLTWVADCFKALVVAVEVSSPEEVEMMWKTYWECLVEECHSWKEFNDCFYTGITAVARVAVRDAIMASLGVTKRVLGRESCMNSRAMQEEEAKRAKDAEMRKLEAVAVAGEQVSTLNLETLTDPEAFLRFIQHNPVRAFEAAPAAMQAYLQAGPAQRVLLFAKLLGLAAMAGGLVRGEPRVLGAFKSPFPLREDPWHLVLAEGGLAESIDIPPSRDEAGRRAVKLLQMQRLLLARTRLLILAGAPDVGKTTVLREAFGLTHLAAGLSQAARTEQAHFELHPEGCERLRPVYIVDTPGFGDGEELHRNDTCRLLMGAGGWIRGGVTLLWVAKAGRNTRQGADELVRRMLDSGVRGVIVVVTHVDRFFEERYREAGPTWRTGALAGLPMKDPQWVEQRRLLMAELKEEILAGLRAVAGDGRDLEIVFACLSGWMVTDEDDEFAQQPPWPWARQEVSSFFNVLDRRGLRRLLDERLGLREPVSGEGP